MFNCLNSATQTVILSMIYIVALSFGLVAAGIVLHELEEDTAEHIRLIFAGGFLITLGWVSGIVFNFHVKKTHMPLSIL